MAPSEDLVREPRDLSLRTISSVGVAVCILGGIFLGGWVWNAVVFIVSLVSLWEFYNIIQRTKIQVSRWLGLGASFLLLLAASLELSQAALLSVVSLIVFAVLFVEVVRRQVAGHSFAVLNMGGTLAGVAYIVLPWSFLILIRFQSLGAFFLVTLFFCTWSCDVAAYLVGTRWGRTPLSEKVSPKKTWEGFLGGVVASLLCGGILAFFWEFPPLTLLLLGLLCGIAGQLGDLGESLLKREAGLKDSGSLIPGHGGMLDRFDSILINATLAFLIFEVLGH